MKTFQNCAAQGDVMFIRVDSIPPNVKLIEPDNRGYHVVAKSETHHDHIVEAAPNVRLYAGDDPMISYLEVIEATDATECLLRHLRDFDTHETIKIPVGIFEIRRQEEYVPEGWRQVRD